MAALSCCRLMMPAACAMAGVGGPFGCAEKWQCAGWGRAGQSAVQGRDLANGSLQGQCRASRPTAVVCAVPPPSARSSATLHSAAAPQGGCRVPWLWPERPVVAVRRAWVGLRGLLLRGRQRVPRLRPRRAPCCATWTPRAATATSSATPARWPPAGGSSSASHSSVLDGHHLDGYRLHGGGSGTRPDYLAHCVLPASGLPDLRVVAARRCRATRGVT